jgi:tRNA threonylcarbamoyl adenosine modification protein (Sua5/YciO/YrdC/YwlC family)
VRTLHVATGDIERDAAITLAIQALEAGQLIIYPTDTLYALGCRASDGAARLRVREAKGRGDAKPLPLVAADLAQVESVCGPLSAPALVLARRFWPGPLTLVLAVPPQLSPEVTAGTGSVAIRVPAHALVRRLCQRVGPLVSTSANRSGASAPSTCAEAVAQVGPAAALALDGGPGGPVASTIVEVTSDVPRLLRAGAIPWSDIAATLRGVPA